MKASSVTIPFRPGRNGILFDMKADFGFGRQWWRFEQWPKFLVDVPQCGVMQEQGFINFSQALEDGDVGGEILTQFDEGADDIKTHGDGARAVEDRSGHQRPVFRESVGSIPPSAAAWF